MCLIDGCRAKHHRLLHEGWSTVKQPIAASQLYTEGNTYPSLIAREGVDNYAAREGESDPATQTMTMCDTRRLDEAFSLHIMPVWLKASERKIKVNTILDDASNESFLNEEAPGALGLREPYQTVKVNVLNNSVETFQTMLLIVEIESINGQFTKEIEVKTCPRTITGNYRAEDWRINQTKWPHLARCDFPPPAKDGLVDLLIGVDNAELHYSFVDVRGKVGEPVARLGPLGWVCIGCPDGRVEGRTRTHTFRTLLVRDPKANCDVDQTLRRFWEI